MNTTKTKLVCMVFCADRLQQHSNYKTIHRRAEPHVTTHPFANIQQRQLGHQFPVSTKSRSRTISRLLSKCPTHRNDFGPSPTTARTFAKRTCHPEVSCAVVDSTGDTRSSHLQPGVGIKVDEVVIVIIEYWKACHVTLCCGGRNCGHIGVALVKWHRRVHEI